MYSVLHCIISPTVVSTATSSSGFFWSDEEVRVLIAILGEANVHAGRAGSCSKKKIVYQNISKKLQDQGFNKEWEQCKAKN